MFSSTPQLQDSRRLLEETEMRDYMVSTPEIKDQEIKESKNAEEASKIIQKRMSHIVEEEVLRAIHAHID